MGRTSKYESSSFEFCRKCGSRVQCIDSRANGDYRRRRHRCPDCGDAFTTREMYIEDYDALRMAREIPEAIAGMVKQLDILLNPEPIDTTPKKARRGRPRKHLIAAG